MKERFDPLEITSKVTMPLTKAQLHRIERMMVERGCRLPKWDRPKWLTEMEEE